MSENLEQTRHRTRGSIFWPLMLVVVGGLLLFGNLGILPEGTWGSLWLYWPVLLILMGLDGIYRNEGLVGGVFLSGLGIVFLLANLGFLVVDVWGLILRLWPVLLIAIGFDVLIGHRSAWFSLLGLVVVLVVLLGSLWLMNVQVSASTPLMGESVQFATGATSRAEITLDPGAGSIILDGGSSPGELVSGSVPQGRGRNVERSYTTSGDTAILNLRETGAGMVVPPGRRGDLEWRLSLAEDFPILLKVDLGAGSLDIDLTRVTIEELEIDAGVGRTVVRIPQTGNSVLDIEQAIGQVLIIVPEGVGVMIKTSAALGTVDIPANFIRRDDAYLSPEFETSDQKVRLRIGLAIGTIGVQTTDAK